MAEKFRQLPSTILRVENDLEAFRIDRAVWLFGSQLQHDLDSVTSTDPAKAEWERKRIIGKWIPEAATPVEKLFRDPAKRS